MKNRPAKSDCVDIIAQLDMPDPGHPDDFSFSIGGMVDNPTEYTLEEIRKLPGRTVRAVTECAGNDGEFFDYIKPGSNMKKPSLRVVQAEEGGWRQTMDSDETPDIEDILQSIPSTGLVSGGEVSMLDAGSVRTRIVGHRRESTDGARLENAKVVIAGGRGVGGREGFEPLNETTRLLGGAVGGSRVACDPGWCPLSRQIGLTGRTVASELYSTVRILAPASCRDPGHTRQSKKFSATSRTQASRCRGASRSEPSTASATCRPAARRSASASRFAPRHRKTVS